MSTLAPESPAEAAAQFRIIEETVPQPVAHPGFVEYWKERAEVNPDDAANARLIEGLTLGGLRGVIDRRMFNGESPGKKAEIWYRNLGPMNDMEDAEADLARAARMSFDPQSRNPLEREETRYHNVNMLVDLARLTDNPQTRDAAWSLARRNLDLLFRPDSAFMRDDKNILETLMLRNSMEHDIIRQRHTGTLEPASLPVKEYRGFEKDVIDQDIRTINTVISLHDSGRPLSFGKMFEIFYALQRRHMAWKDELLDVVSVRSATSREDMSTQAGVEQEKIKSQNFDVMVRNGRSTTRLQLKSIDDGRKYDERFIQVVDYSKIVKKKHLNFKEENANLVGAMRKMLADYQLGH